MVVPRVCRIGLTALVHRDMLRLTGCEGIAFLNVPGVIKRYQQLQVFFTHVISYDLAVADALVSRGRLPEGKRLPVPAVDGDDDHRQLD